MSLKYQKHNYYENEYGNKLEFLLSDGKINVVVHYQFYSGVSSVRSWKTITNISGDNIGLEYVPSFSYTGLCEENLRLFIPHNSWCSEVDWEELEPSRLGMKKVYLDAPVLDLNTWPPEGSVQRGQLYQECSLNAQTIATYVGNPVNNLAEFFANGLPLLVVAGGADEVVPFAENAGRLLAYAEEHGVFVERYIKPTCGHHPHSLEDVSPIVSFVRA